LNEVLARLGQEVHLAALWGEEPRLAGICEEGDRRRGADQNEVLQTA